MSALPTVQHEEEGHDAMPLERVSHLESRTDGIEVTLNQHVERLTELEGKVVDVRLGMAQLHGDLKLNNQATEQIQKSVASIESDTKEMIAVYRATPRQRDDVRWWAWIVAAVWATLMAGATVVQAIAAFKG